MKKQDPPFNVHLGARQERALHKLCDNTDLSPGHVSKAVSIRLRKDRELALNQVSINKGLDRVYEDETIVSNPKAGWTILVKNAVDDYLDWHCPDWQNNPTDHVVGLRKGWSKIIGAAVDKYLDGELPGWRA